ncbi:Lipase_GDSL domain-containing protein [Cinnamomum micranthum f. kanehirae]|uniref:Lipase_GDSL domain-containing protein n=1 Tax=Cinnamomum micranthum f. kanehirae TaxID=337451 RepID=A0A3S3NJH1_9MAGN|nr:Lipase_GDSL domain-containing protein [Cinnamomum micranthum f. kanehirae]
MQNARIILQNHCFLWEKSVVTIITTHSYKILIEQGAVELVVPGKLPIGCSPGYLTLFSSSKKENYNPRNGWKMALILWTMRETH